MDNPFPNGCNNYEDTEKTIECLICIAHHNLQPTIELPTFFVI